MQPNRQMVWTFIALSLVSLANTPSIGGAQPPAQPSVGYLAKASLLNARTEAKKWRSDAYLFQVTGRRVTNGVAMWNYDFFSAGAGEKKCLRVSFARGRAFTTQLECERSSELPDFAIDSDKAVEIARQAGVTRPDLTVGLMMTPVGSGERAGWTVMEGTGTRSGDMSVDIDAMTGAVRGKQKMP